MTKVSQTLADPRLFLDGWIMRLNERNELCISLSSLNEWEDDMGRRGGG